jgi:hypothetical protein
LSGYVYSRISENYRRIAEAPTNRMPMRYRELQHQCVDGAMPLQLNLQHALVTVDVQLGEALEGSPQRSGRRGGAGG